MGETWQGLNTDSAANLLIFSTLAQTHDFNNHSKVYGRSRTALVRSVADCRKIRFFDGLKLGNGFGIGEDYDF
jgi:hypothetical protein